ncbi:cyclin-T1-4 [Lolium perenne]|uniref:cyclin-T1-4 n=1 Tax=Lolium perenne TaxID=4522 RepID=UPI0021F50F35|nr:cyclin-T1-4-like [Lolium perenne]XP_051184356.1 cyclin-T1-4-like [Lolium perenne]XP_051184360.1 cyclin-T1-4-like [Lolium perenne]
MAMLPIDSSHHGIVENSPYRITKSGNEEVGKLGASWYFTRKEIEENSPSKKDGIDLKKESYLRKSYCTYLQDLGMRLKVPQVTIATSIVFCHRFYLRQSHAKNDRRTIATVCMFLAGKVEETPRPLKDVIMVSYELIHKKDPAAGQKIKQREVYDRQKELILLGERVVLATLGFDLNVHHPYKPLVETIKKFKITHNALPQVAWNFVNDGLRTSLCLQFKSHHIAAGALFLAGKFLKVKFLPDDGEKAWYQEFDVTPRQLEEVSNQMLELYEQNRVVQSQPTHGNEAEGSSAIVPNQGISVKAQAKSEEPPVLGHHQASKQSDSNHSTSTGVPIHNGAEDSDRNKQINSQRSLQNVSGDHGIDKTSCQSGVGVGAGINDGMHDDTKSLPGSSRSSDKSDIPMEEQKPFLSHASSCETRDGNLSSGDVPSVSSSMMDAMNKIDKDKVKAALEKQRRLKGDVARNVDVMDDEDLLESELERGVELTVEDEKIKSGDVAENGDHGEQNVPEAEVLVDVKEECSPAKRNDGFEQVPEPS